MLYAFLVRRPRSGRRAPEFRKGWTGGCPPALTRVGIAPGARWRSGVPSAALLVAGLLLGGAGGAAAEILLNEVLSDPARDWNGSGAVSSRDDEWIEIINTGSTSVDLASFRLAGPDSVWRYEFSGLLAPGAVRLVTGRESYDWETVQGFPAFGLRLSNSGGEIMLFEMVSGVPVLRDCYAWVDHEADDDRSSGRAPDGGPSWLLFDGLNPYSGSDEPAGSGCTPSPGTRQVCVTPVEAASWSTLKALYGSPGD